MDSSLDGDHFIVRKTEPMHMPSASESYGWLAGKNLVVYIEIQQHNF